MGTVSTILSMGTLLSQAEAAGSPVRVLVEGQWITGTPLSCDGHGALLENGDGQFLVRVQAISAISYDPAMSHPRAQRRPGPGS